MVLSSVVVEISTEVWPAVPADAHFSGYLSCNKPVGAGRAVAGY